MWLTTRKLFLLGLILSLLSQWYVVYALASVEEDYECKVCGYVYDPEKGDPTADIPPGTPFEELPNDWTCPECGAGTEEFEQSGLPQKVTDKFLSIISQWYAVILLIGPFIIFLTLFLEIKSKNFSFIERNMRSLLPLEITTTSILKSGITFVGVGLFTFHTFLLFDVLPLLSDWQIQSEFLVVSGEVFLFGILILLLAFLIDIPLFRVLEPKQRDLQRTIRNSLNNIRYTSKTFLIGSVILIFALFILEVGLLYQRFFDDDAWVIDPLLNVIDHSIRFLGYVINPILALIGISEIKPLFTAGEWRESDPALFRVIFRFMGEGAVLTLTTSLAGLIFGLIIGTICGTISVSTHIPIPLVGRRISLAVTRMLHSFVRTYVEVFRGTPLLAQIFFIWFGGAQLMREYVDPNFVFDPVSAGIIALTLNTGAYQTEIIRSGIQAIPSGQLEAARSLGMTYSQGMNFVVLPQAFRIIIPPLTNEFISLLLNSSLLSVLSVFEMTRWARNLNNTTFRSPEVFASLMIAYFAMTFVLSRIFKKLEERIRIPGFGVT